MAAPIPALVNSIYQQFVDYFGEEHVDLQMYGVENLIRERRYYDTEIGEGDYLILVYWPSVTITNEYDSHIDIWDLYSLTAINAEGKLLVGPLFNRSTYDPLQWNSNYMHSHVSSIPKNNLSEFQPSCLGSGPIIHTKTRLNDNPEDLDIWKLYCWELDKYVEVESISGVPYHRMSSLGGDDSNAHRNFETFPYIDNNLYKTALIQAIIIYVIENKLLKFSYCDGRYQIANGYINTVLILSNAFIDLYNNNADIRKTYKKEALLSKKFIENGVIKNDALYLVTSNNVPLEVANGTKMFTFKGKEVKLRIKDEVASESITVTIINHAIIDYIVHIITKFINIKYGKDLDAPNKKIRII